MQKCNNYWCNNSIWYNIEIVLNWNILMSESADSSNIFNSQFNNEYKVLEDLSSFKSRRSETGMNDENNFFFLNFVHSSDWGGRDDVSVVQSNYQAKTIT